MASNRISHFIHCYIFLTVFPIVAVDVANIDLKLIAERCERAFIASP